MPLTTNPLRRSAVYTARVNAFVQAQNQVRLPDCSHGWACCPETGDLVLAYLSVRAPKRLAGVGTKALRLLTNSAHAARLVPWLQPYWLDSVLNRAQHLQATARLTAWYKANGYVATQYTAWLRAPLSRGANTPVALENRK